MQICIHQKDNSSKPVNHRLTLKEGPKVKSDNIRTFLAHDILQVGFTLQTSRYNNKQLTSTFKFGCPHLTLKESEQLAILPVQAKHQKRCFVSPPMEVPACTPLTRCRDLLFSWLEKVTSLHLFCSNLR